MALYLKMNGKEPCIDQGIIGRWILTWNPDDKRFYVQHGEEKARTFKKWTNATYYARTHS